MLEIQRVGVALGARFAQPSAQGELVVVPGASPVLRMFNPVLNETVVIVPGAAGPVVEGFAVQGAARVPVTVGGVAGSLPVDMIAAAQLPGAGGLTGHLTPGAPLQARAVEMLAVDLGGQAYLIAARPAGSGVEAFRIGPGQALTAVSALVDTGASALAGVAALAGANVGGRVFVYAGSALEHGVTVLELGAGGVLSRGSVVGQAQGVPLQGVSALETVAAFGATWLVAAAAGSSSLTVFRIGADGVPVPVDHVTDALTTRFQAVTALEVVTHGDWVFVIAAGADEGLSVFAMTRGGRLVHLATQEDRLDLGLANISALRAVVVGDRLQVLALSGAEAGLTQLALPLAGLGAVVSAFGGVASGGAGRDLILDGAGAEVLSGGAGADVFVMRADGQRDVIADFDPAMDRIDLTAWPMLRNMGQVAVQPTATGAILRFGAEELELRSADGRGFSTAQVRALDFGAGYRLGFAGEAEEPSGPGEGADDFAGGRGMTAFRGWAGMTGSRVWAAMTGCSAERGTTRFSVVRGMTVWTGARGRIGWRAGRGTTCWRGGRG
ncbi:hypothetical protein TabM4_14460 [Tabrizicola sp. M-4]